MTPTSTLRVPGRPELGRHHRLEVQGEQGDRDVLRPGERACAADPARAGLRGRWAASGPRALPRSRSRRGRGGRAGGPRSARSRRALARNTGRWCPTPPTITSPPDPSRSIRACSRDTLGSVRTMSLSGDRPIRIGVDRKRTSRITTPSRSTRIAIIGVPSHETFSMRRRVRSRADVIRNPLKFRETKIDSRGLERARGHEVDVEEARRLLEGHHAGGHLPDFRRRHGPGWTRIRAGRGPGRPAARGDTCWCDPRETGGSHRSRSCSATTRSARSGAAPRRWARPSRWPA